MKSKTWSNYGRAVGNAVERIILGLDEKLDLDDLAREAALSPFHFHRIFRGMVGETPLQLHRRLRLERAAWSLLHEDVPVTTVAYRAGYETPEAFSRSFVAAYGRSPSSFRARGVEGVDEAVVDLPTAGILHFRPGMSARPRLESARGDADVVVHIEELPELRLALVRHIGPYHLLAGAFRKLLALAESSRLFRPETMVMAIYRDDPEMTPEDLLRSDAAITVPAGAELPDGLEPGRLRGGRYARATHLGPYEQLGEAWADFMGKWLPESGESIGDGVPFEIYRNDPTHVPPEKLRTDLFLSLSPLA